MLLFFPFYSLTVYQMLGSPFRRADHERDNKSPESNIKIKINLWKKCVAQVVDMSNNVFMINPWLINGAEKKKGYFFTRK